MRHLAPRLLWMLTALGLLLLMILLSVAIQNTSGHTGWEPLTSLACFAPLLAIGSGALVLSRRDQANARPAAAAVVVGLVGVVLLFWLDQTNTLVQYERWLERKMPEQGAALLSRQPLSGSQQR